MELPFVFRSAQHAYNVLDGEVGTGVLNELAPHNLKGLAYWENGWRAFTNNKRPVTKPDDLKGLKIRSTPNPYHIQAFKLLGMNPSPMPIAELYTALETGTFKSWPDAAVTFPRADGVYWHNWVPPILILQYTKPGQDWKEADIVVQYSK